jgi:hypothetical protein
MRLKLKFKSIVDAPKYKILVNNVELYSGPAMSEFEYDYPCNEGQCSLVIEHWDKLPSDTIVQDNKIVRDKSFELDQIIIDEYDIEELIWNSEFLAEDGQTYTSCLFFGPNGKFILNFYNPVLYWILKTRHEKNNNDPNWEEDYNYYQQACKILKQI